MYCSNLMSLSIVMYHLVIIVTIHHRLHTYCHAYISLQHPLQIIVQQVNSPCRQQVNSPCIRFLVAHAFSLAYKPCVCFVKGFFQICFVKWLFQSYQTEIVVVSYIGDPDSWHKKNVNHWWPRLMAQEEGQEAPSVKEAISITAVSIKISPFWPADSQIWFALLEAQFCTRGITAEKTISLHRRRPSMYLILSRLHQHHMHNSRNSS